MTDELIERGTAFPMVCPKCGERTLQIKFAPIACELLDGAKSTQTKKRLAQAYHIKAKAYQAKPGSDERKGLEKEANKVAGCRI
jgi:hypothetical protein